MTRRSLYAALISTAFDGLDVQDRLRFWVEVETSFVSEYMRAHPMASPQSARQHFASLAAEIMRARE